MQTFDNDEQGYLHWVRNNPAGYVINSPKHPGYFPDMLHKATCAHISTEKHTNYTTTDFMKRCSLSRQELLQWGKGSSDFRECKSCKP